MFPRAFLGLLENAQNFENTLSLLTTYCLDLRFALVLDSHYVSDMYLNGY